jgi:hypothetical protein
MVPGDVSLSTGSLLSGVPGLSECHPIRTQTRSRHSGTGSHIVAATINGIFSQFIVTGAYGFTV